MQPLMGRAVTCLVLVASASAAKDAGSISAVQKVVQMLTDMKAKAVDGKRAEEVAFSSFTQWCADQQATLTNQVKVAGEGLEVMQATIAKLESDMQKLGEDISGLQNQITKNEADIKAQTAQRETDHKAFLANQQDFAESVDALERAIMILSKQNYDRTALLQLALPANAQQMVKAFLGMMQDSEDGSDSPLDVSAPEANAYEFQSGGIVEMLKKLLGEFNEQKAQLEKEEMNSKHAFNMIVQDLTGSRDQATDDSSQKTANLAEKKERNALLKKEEATTSKAKAEDETMLSDVKVECDEKKLSFEEKQQLRTEELEAMTKAIEILSSEDVQGAADKHLALAQNKPGMKTFVQIEGKGKDNNAAYTSAEGIFRHVRDFLDKESTRLHSKTLGLIAQKMAADPFVKVKKLIEDMITRLLEEANSDADHKGFCDKELGQSKITRNKLSETIDGLNADIENAKATVSTLKQDISRLAQEVNEIDVSVQKATEIRTKESEQNKLTIEDATAAQSAVQQAVAVLKDFYGKASVATAMIQVKTNTALPTTEWGESQGVKMGSDEWNALSNPNFEGKVDLGHKEGMQTFGDTYRGAQDEAGGVLAMLEVIASDFSRLQADTETAEAIAAKTYKDFMAESSKDKAVKSRSSELAKSDLTSTEAKMRDDIQDLKFSQDKLLAAERYFDKLKPQCLDGGMTYDDRHQARAEEIQSLKEALRILEGQ